MKQQRIGIVGAGTAGLATATLLVKAGHRVTLLERAPELQPVGAGLLLQPTGIAALDRLGCLDTMLRLGHRIDALYGDIPGGRAVMNVRYEHLETDDCFGLGVHRASLCHVLDQALAAVPHQRWFGCAVEGLEDHGREVRIRFVRDGQSHQEAFDAVIVANGSASQLRPQHLVTYNRPYPWGAMWLIRPLSEDLARFRVPVLQQRYSGSRVMIGMLPTGATPAAPDTPMVSLFWSLPVADMPAWGRPDFDLAGWKAAITGHWPEVGPLVDRIEHPRELLPATYRDVILSRWGTGRIGVIGDAAHAMSPQLGQGANMALLDALALADAVADCDDWDAVWQQFDQSRRGSIRFYQRMSWLLTPFFQSAIPGIGVLRDLTMPLAYHLPWLRRQMTETVAGRKQRWL